MALETRLNPEEKELAKKYLGLSETGMPWYLYLKSEEERIQYIKKLYREIKLYRSLRVIGLLGVLIILAIGIRHIALSIYTWNISYLSEQEPIPYIMILIVSVILLFYSDSKVRIYDGLGKSVEISEPFPASEERDDSA